MPVAVDPPLIRRNAVRGIETQTLKNLCRDVGAFLRRIGLDGMQPIKFRRQPPESIELALDTRPAAIAAGKASPQRIGIDQLPETRHRIGRVLRQERMKECRAAPRQSGDEYRPYDPAVEDFGPDFLGCLEAQEIAEAAQHVETCGIAPEDAETGFFVIGAKEPPQRIGKRKVRKTMPVGTAQRRLHERIGIERTGRKPCPVRYPVDSPQHIPVGEGIAPRSVSGNYPKGFLTGHGVRKKDIRRSSSSIRFGDREGFRAEPRVVPVCRTEIEIKTM